jgi:uncharacterized membrane protein
MDIWLAWLAAVTTGIEPLIVKISSKRLIKSPWLFNVLWMAFALPPIAVFAWWQHGGWPMQWMALTLSSLCAAVTFSLYTLALYKMDVTAMAPLYGIRMAFSVLLGTLLLGEHLSGFGIGLIVLIIAASPFATFNEQLRFRAFLQKHTLFALIAMLTIALDGYFLNRSVAQNGFATTVLWHDLLTLALLLPTLRFAHLERERFTREKITPFVALGLLAFVYAATSAYAYSRNLSINSIIVSLPFSMIFAWALSFRFPALLEKHPPRVYAVRFTGAAIMVGGAIWLSLL